MLDHVRRRLSKMLRMIMSDALADRLRKHEVAEGDRRYREAYLGQPAPSTESEVVAAAAVAEWERWG